MKDWLGGLFLGLMTQAWAAGADAPALFCPDPLFDFGVIAPDGRVSHAYVLTNRGDRVVAITNVRAGCSCASVRLETNAVAPGASTRLFVEFNAAGRRGLQRKPFYLQTDDPRAALLRLEINGTVVPPIDVMPEGLHFGTVGMTNVHDKESVLTAVGTNRFTVVGVKSSNPAFTATAEPVETGRVYRVMVRCEAPRPLGTSSASILVETDHPALRTVMIPVAVFTAADVVSAPASLLLIPTATNLTRTYYLSVYSPSGKDFAVTNRVVPKGIECSMTNLASGRYRLELKAGGSLAGLDGAVLKLQTDLDSVPQVEVSLRVLALRDGAGTK